jgi:hypothetical protein
VTGKCSSSQCTDLKQDGNETGVDCGGGSCPMCANGLGCKIDTDCTSNACDANTLTCIANQCADHRQDGVETDIDCGGANICPRCLTGEKCKVNGDCLAGHTCSGSPVPTCS